MTTKFMTQCGITNHLAVVETYEKLDIVESCIDALGSGLGEARIISTATTYTHSMFYEILENVKETLLKLVQRVLSVLNNYYLNNVKLLEKYREVILDRLDKMKEPIKHETFEYPEVRDYPHAIRTTSGIEKDIIKLHDDIRSGNLTSEKVGSRIDKLLQFFGKEVLETAPDPFDLRSSTKKIVEKRVRGKPVTVTIDRQTLDKYIEQITTYKRDKDDIMRARKNLIDDYELLKKTYAGVTKNPTSIITNRIQAIADPDKEAFMANEYSRYAAIHVEMMRLFNGYIAIYQAAFDTKLQELQNKINDNKNTIVAIITQTGLFAALNTKSTDKNKPIPYNPVYKV